MNFSYKKFRIKCNHPFGISRSSHDHYDIVYLYLENNGFVGRGEAAPSDRYNESTDLIIRILENGIRIMVPPFLQEGEKVEINTEDLSYSKRAE